MSLEIEALESRERNRVLGVVKEKAELAAFLPAIQAAVEVAAEGVAESAEPV